MTCNMYVCTGAHEGQRLERAANMIIAIIHILSSIIIQKCRHPSLLLSKKRLIYSPAGILVKHIVK